MIYLDTHVVVWLYMGLVERIPLRQHAALEAGPVLISPMVLLELEYLYEIKKITVAGRAMVDDLAARLGISYCTQPFPVVANQALGESWTRDPFDRIIVAQARVQNAVLLTKDRTIRKRYPLAQWE